MRKFLSMLLVLTLMFALAVPAFADHAHNGSKVFDQNALPDSTWSDEKNECTFDAGANLTPTGSVGATKVYKVKIEWSCAEITGNVQSTYKWVTEDFAESDAKAPHYEVVTSKVVGETAGGEVTITIKNRSNNAVNADVAYVAVEDSSDFTPTEGRSVHVPDASSNCNVHNLDGAETMGEISGTVTLKDEDGVVWNGLGKGGCTTIGTFTVTITPQRLAA